MVSAPVCRARAAAPLADASGHSPRRWQDRPPALCAMRYSIDHGFKPVPVESGRIIGLGGNYCPCFLGARAE
eukprot:4196041-Pyramimonas_sp.AAC.1